mmetsp:Transcript_54559/g.130162  ORF Transcript_54559/g.130162 Transcript_54559/m.130162 type:complete len:507 (-) Transcript_54559:137-1657(-)
MEDSFASRMASEGVAFTGSHGAMNVDIFDCISTTSILQAGFSRLDRLCESLQDRVEVLELQQRSLEGCLKEAGSLRADDYLSRLHRHSFDATRSRYPFESKASLADLCLDRDLRFHIGAFSGWATLRRCSNTHSALRGLTGLIPQMMYVIGGFDGHSITSSMERLDPKGCDIWDAWEQASKPMESESKFGACLCVNRKQPLSDPHFQAIPLNPADAFKGVWEAVPSMKEKRAGFAAATVSGSLYVCGGFNGRSFLSSVEHYTWSLSHPRGVWESLSNMSTPRHCPAAAGVDGNLVVCGGYDGVKALSSVEQYDKGSGRWRMLPDLLEARHGACAAAVGSSLFVCGGFNGEEVLQTLESLNLARGVWEPLARLTVPRNVASAAAFSGKIYVCGGCNGKDSLPSVECFDPRSGCWEKAPSMRSCRHGGAAIVADGHLFVCGGGDNAQAPGQLLSTIERFRPGGLGEAEDLPSIVKNYADSSWSTGVPLAVPRGDVAAVALFTPLYTAD